MNVLDIWYHKKTTTGILAFLILFLGLVALNKIPFDLAPTIEYPQLNIQTMCYNSTPEIIEATVTAPIESRLQQIPGIKKISSRSQTNASMIKVELQRHVDIPYTIFLVNEMLSDYKEWLPAEVAAKPEVIKYNPEDVQKQEFISFELLSDMDESHLYEVFKSKIKRPLESIEGVSQVREYGIRQPAIHITVDPDKLENYGIDWSDIYSLLNRSNHGAGIILKKNYRMTVKIDNEYKSLADLRETPIKKIGSRLVTLGEIATIRIGYNQQFYKERIDGKPTYGIELDKESSANTIKVADAVFKKIALIKKDLPPGMLLLVQTDASKKIKSHLSQLGKCLFISLLFIFYLLAIGFGNVKSSILILFNIILCLLFVILTLYLIDYTLNLLTIAGLALGLGFLVDNAILVYDCFDKDPEEKSISTFSSRIKIILPAIIASTVTTLAALAPFLFLIPKLGIYYRPFAIVVGITLIASVVFAILFLPGFMKQKKKQVNLKLNPIVFLEKLVLMLEKKLIRFPKSIVFVALLLIGIPLWLLPGSITEVSNQTVSGKLLNKTVVPLYNNTIGSSFYQTIREYSDPILGGSTYLFIKHVSRGKVWDWKNETRLNIYLKLPQGAQMHFVDEGIQKFEKLALHQSGVKRVRTYISERTAYMEISFTDKAIVNGIHYALKAKCENLASAVGGAIISVYGIGEGYSSGGNSNFSNFNLVLTGYNYQELKNLALQLGKRLKKSVRIRDIDYNASGYYSNEKMLQLRLDMERWKIAGLGINFGELSQNMMNYTNHSFAWNKMNLGGREYNFMIKTINSRSTDVSRLLTRILHTADGKMIKLKNVSRLQEEEIPGEIRRENQQYIRNMSFNYIGPLFYGQKYVHNCLQTFHIPPGYKIEMKKFNMFSKEAQSNLLFVILIGLLLIYMVTAALYESFKDPFIIFLTIPSGLIGIFYMYYVFDKVFSASAYIGVLFISGIVVNNAIILVNQIKHFRKSGKDLSSAILDGLAFHLRPILLTSLSTILGFLPMILLKTKANLWYDLAFTGIGGIFSTTLFTIFVLPCIYYLFEKKRS